MQWYRLGGLSDSFFSGKSLAFVLKNGCKKRGNHLRNPCFLCVFVCLFWVLRWCLLETFGKSICEIMVVVLFQMIFKCTVFTFLVSLFSCLSVDICMEICLLKIADVGRCFSIDDLMIWGLGLESLKTIETTQLAELQITFQWSRWRYAHPWSPPLISKQRGSCLWSLLTTSLLWCLQLHFRFGVNAFSCSHLMSCNLPSTQIFLPFSWGCFEALKTTLFFSWTGRTGIYDPSK